MRQVRELMRLHREAGLGMRATARLAGIAESTMRDMVKRFESAGLTWPVAAELSNAELEHKLYGLAGRKPGQRKLPEPDWAMVHRELKRKYVTLQTLWEEYIEAHPKGYRYSRFCDLYRGWEGRLPVTMRQTHQAGDKVFVDYAGDKQPVVVDRLTGETREAHIFVAVMGASSLSFACATWSETLADWTDAHVRAFAAFGGAPRLLVPDNAKVAVIKACLYDPQVNRSYADLARHYGAACLPTRPRRPRDKAKVEACVGIVERWLFGRLRNVIFYSLAELNAAIALLIARLNDERVLRHFGQTRRQLFEALDAPLLTPLPAEPYVFAEWRARRVGIDYHVEVEHHFYSVPHRFARKPVEARLTARTVEIFLNGERIAAHMRGSGNGRHTTVPDHMASAHRRYADWTLEKILAESARIGPCAQLLCEKILEDRPHPEQGFRSCKGILGLEKRFGAARLEAAAQRALEIGSRNFPSLKSILEKGLEGQPLSPAPGDHQPIEHGNIRGSSYYH
ncbi:IS21 family transposase [Sphingobium sp. KCTC 72723]|uniref:IS21 family transposase n=2 Tax=Alphaproteobacteria TaxID=28211 RepID=UPI00165D770E|nr:IS21 family transposase [Sphingobium sp. KCTC 72723]